MLNSRLLLVLLPYCLNSSAILAQPRGYFTEPIVVNPIGFGAAIDARTVDDLTLYFSNCGTTGCGEQNGDSIDIWMATRSSVDEPFDNATLIEALSTDDHDAVAAVAEDGLSLYFMSDRDGNWDVYHAGRESQLGPFNEAVPIAELNTGEAQLAAALTSDETTIVYSEGPFLGSKTRLWISERPDKQTPFGVSRPVFSDEFSDDWPTLSSDGLTLFFVNRNSHAVRLGNRGNADIYVAFRESTSDDFGVPVNLNDAFAGTSVNRNEWQFSPYISPRWPAPGSLLYFTATESRNGLVDIIKQSTWIAQGDIDMDHEFTSADVDLLMSAIRGGASDHIYDMDGDGDMSPDRDDLTAWVRDIKATWFGDANLDGEFNSTDLVEVFQAGEYQDDVDLNSTWQTGDWDGDGEFDSGDFVVAFQEGGFEMGPRTQPTVVPEPMNYWAVVMLVLALRRRRETISVTRNPISRHRFLLVVATCAISSAAIAGPPRGYFTEPIDVNPIGFGSAIEATSLDDLTLYFSNCGHPDCGSQNGDNIDIWLATRNSTDEPFGNAASIDELNTDADDGLATVADNGLSLYFRSDRDGDWDLFHTSRVSQDVTFGEARPIIELNTGDAQIDASLSADETTIVYSQGEQLDAQVPTRLLIAERGNLQSPFEDSRPVFDDAFNDGWPTLSRDGLTLFFVNRSNGPLRPQSRGNSDIYVAFRESVSDDFGDATNLNDAFTGTRVNTREFQYMPFISPKWPAPGSLLYFSTAEASNDFVDTIKQSTWIAQGDINMDHEFTSTDVNLLMSAIRGGASDHIYDMDGDGDLSPGRDDLIAWVRDIKATWFGDANLDGEFNSTDLVEVFQAGEYQDGGDINSTWQTGDWDGDGEFDSGDFVFAFQEGGFEMGPRTGMVIVPEPMGCQLVIVLFLIGGLVERETFRIVGSARKSFD